MLLALAASTQALLLSELLLRRVLCVFVPARRAAVQRYADNSVLSALAAACLQTATLPLQAVGSLLGSFSRFAGLLLVGMLLFAALAVLSNSSVYAYRVLTQMYNTGVAPVVGSLKWLFVLLDFVFRATVPLWNGLTYLGSQILRRVVLPYSFTNVEVLPELLQALALFAASLGQSVLTWLEHVRDCTVSYGDQLRVCGGGNGTLAADCSSVFTPLTLQCHAAPNHLSLDLLTPGLFARQAALALQRAVAESCGVAALVLNLLLFPLCDHQLYAAAHAGANTVLFAAVGLPVSTWRRCRALDGVPGVLAVHKSVGCTPDWEPVAALAEAALARAGDVVNNWLNAAAVLAWEQLSGEAPTCGRELRMSEVVLDAARAIEGLESVEALVRLQGQGGMPQSETLQRVRVVGLTPQLFGVSDGKSVLYRSPHDGYVLAFGAWPFPVDVRLGLAAVTYGGSLSEADTTGDARTGLLGCRCVDEPEFALWCATAPYVQHVDDELAGLNASSVHKVSFPDLLLAGLTCANTEIRVLPLRWPRRRLATAEGNGGSGFAGYTRFSYLDIASQIKGDQDATDNLRVLANRHRATPSGAVEAAVFVQPVCGGHAAASVTCARAEARNCYPWCMGVVRGGRRAQNVSMFNMRRWEDHVTLPDVDCGVRRESLCADGAEAGAEAAAGTAGAGFVDIMARAGVVQGRCHAAKSCTPHPVPAAVMSMVPLASIAGGANSTIDLVRRHKQEVWLGVRSDEQPFVVAGDVMLALAEAAGEEVVVVTRLYDIGQSTLQVASERLTLVSNAHAVRVATCPTEASTRCVALAMQAGRVVLPTALREIRSSGVAESGVLPHAAASRWAVHWAENPEISVYNAVFEFCNNRSAFALMQISSYNRARVWTLQTMRSVDLEREGSPSEEQERSRVSYMRVPDFLDFAHLAGSEDACERVVGLRVEGVELLNEQNVLVTVAAARPKDYDPVRGAITGPRTHRYYYLHPGRHDCVRTDEEDRLDGDPAVFSCWRAQSRGPWPADEVLASAPLTSTQQAQCPGALAVPAFGSAMVMPLIVLVHVAEAVLDAVCTLPALLAANPRDPTLAMEELFTLELRQSTFHGMVDSAGARLFKVDDIVTSSRWLATFFAHLMVYAVNGLAAAAQGAQLPAGVDKTVSGLRTLVVGGAKVYEGMPRADGPLAVVEGMFREPASYSAHSASMAVLTMADNLQGGNAMNPLVGMFIKAQLSLVSTLELTLRLGRVVLVRLVQTVGAAARGRASAGALISSALLESRAIVDNDWLDQMRFQCYGLAQMLGSRYAWGQAVRHLCLLAPDTLEGAMTVGTVLVLEYPLVSCACKLGEGEALGRVSEICMSRPLPVESSQWLLELNLATASQQQVCFAAMDSANARLHTAFDKTYRRLYELTRHAAQVVDGLLALVTGDTVACDAYDVSPYVISIIPEPVDYFTSCIDTEDCRARCLDEMESFEESKARLRSYRPGLVSTLAVPLESMLFSIDDIEKGLNRPPFLVLDAVELPRPACLEVCTRRGREDARNRCLLLAGLRGAAPPLELAVAYYCLPIDITQYAYQWQEMGAQAAAPLGFAALADSLRALSIATSWGAQFLQRDSLIAVVQGDDAVAGTQGGTTERVTRVLWFVPGLPARELFRTSLRAERQLVLEASVPLNKGFLYEIEHTVVDTADTSTGIVVLRVYGYRMERELLRGSELPVYTWKAPSKQCVECEFLGDPRDFDGVRCALCAPRPGQDVAQMARFDQTHTRVCVRQLGDASDSGCAELIALPRSGPSVPDRVAQNDLLQKKSEVYTQVLSGGEIVSKSLAAPASSLNVFRSYGAYTDMQQQVHARQVLVSRVVYLEAGALESLRKAVAPPTAADTPAELDLALEVLVVNGGDVDGAWMQVLALRLQDQGVSATEREWLRAETTASLLVNCSIHDCRACAWSAGVERPELRELENLCYAAQQCGVERCAGTLVNMRKPLCNLGSVLAGEMKAIRVLLQGLWGAVADNIAMVVELTHQRREQFEVKWPELLVRRQACTAKDAIVSSAASITSIFGAFSHLMQDVSVHNGFVGSAVDSRVHARYIMVLTATTNLLSSVMMMPVYQSLVLQKFFACTANDVSYAIENLIAAPGSTQRTMTIRFGDSARQEAISRARIAVCLSEDVQQSLRDAGLRAGASASKPASGTAASGTTPQSTAAKSGNAVTKKISEAISNSVDLTLGTFIQYATHVLDVWLTWGASVLRGFMDVAQTVDWQMCKLPVVDTGLQSLGLCACGDEAYAIPAEERARDWTQQAFWCSGLLMLNEGDGSDLLVWNPFSLEELLAMEGSGARDGAGVLSTLTSAVLGQIGGRPRNTMLRSMAGRRLLQAAGTFDEYVLCLRGRWDSASKYFQESCEGLRPAHVRLTQQGVEVMQVISRCRANYQQSRWDEASALYGLFTVAEWASLGQLGSSASARQDDKYSQLRKQVVRLLENDRDVRAETGLALAQPTWDCLRDALDAGVLQHNCHRSLTAFEYTKLAAEQVLPSLTDACKVASVATDTGVPFPRFMWSGSSSNHAPLAKLHAEQLTGAQRRAHAEAALQTLLETHIRPRFEELLSEAFAQELRQHLQTEAFSAEGDELHQLVDCVVLGPYSSADLNSNVHLGDAAPLPVPQYHRGQPDSREFTAWGPTGGSQARQDLMKLVFDVVNEQAEDITAAAARKHVAELAAVWLEPDNYRCICPGGSRDWSCCDGDAPADFVLRDTTLSQQEWQIQNTVAEATFQRVAESSILREFLWTTHAGSPITLTDAQRSELQAAQVFALRDGVPVRTYSAADTVPALNTHSLWETCTSRVAGLFSTMPFTPPEVNAERGRAPGESAADIPEQRVEDYDPVRDYDAGRMHSMEMLVDGLLERARAVAPHFWTHAHRYVPSDSVWCEGGSTRETPTPPETTTPPRLHEHALRTERVLAPGPEQLLYPAGVLRACACGWRRDDVPSGCYVPAAVSARAESVWAAGDAETRQLWAQLRDGGTYGGTKDGTHGAARELVLVLQVLRALPPEALADANCSSRRPSLAWGLLSPAEHDAWYAGARGNWTFDAQHLAAAGPAGLRLGMLSPSAPETLEAYVQHFDLGEGLRDTFNARYRHTVGQPVCSGTLREHLPDDLRAYFVDVFVPMAHAVQIVPAVEHCSRWVLEYAMLAVLRRAEDGPQSLLETVAAQAAAAELWRGRCAAQMHEVGLCVLRGVYDIVPNGTQPAPECAFAGSGHRVSGCARFYYTSSCLLFCDGAFYDPCLCAEPATACEPRPFSPGACRGGLLVDGRELLRANEGLLTSSLRWPGDIPPAEAADDAHWEALRASLLAARSLPAEQQVDFASLFSQAKAALLERPDDEGAPHAYCDDLFDYWPDAQHPVGYHPSTACSAAGTNTRGFAAWMSRDGAGATLLDPARMRNWTQASRVFGASHLVCDAFAYAAPGHALNPYYLQSKWKRQAEADPAVPVTAPPVELVEMSVFGSPSFDGTDTALRVQGHSADALLEHSVGLVRAWARWFTPPSDNRSAAAAQELLDTVWPHWLPDEQSRLNSVLENSGLFLSRSRDPPAGCAFPRLLRCRVDAECRQGARELVCLLNHNEEANSRRGVCMHKDSCYQHQHCPPAHMCSGEGRCVEPKIFVRNSAEWDAEVQLFGRDGGDTSMERLSRFESVPDFATANGMCTFRNWYHYLNATAGGKDYDKIIDVRDKEVFRTNLPERQTLQELGVLKTLAHQCDRSYAHTDFLACTAIAATVTQRERVEDAARVHAAQTWRSQNGTWHARFCSMPGGTVSGFLSPYNAGSLKNARRDIRRCIEFNLCPSTKFHVRGRAVESRRVQVHEAREDSPFGVEAVAAARDYCSLDAQRCWGMGFLLGRDCEEVARDEGAVCVVDRLVLPLLGIVYAREDTRQFPATRPEFAARLLDLRGACARAFRSSLGSEEDELSLFIRVYEHLTQPYAWTDSDRRALVAEYANRLLWLVFGEARGFADLAGYLSHSHCAVFLARRLSEQERGFAEQQSFTYYASSSPDPVLPGASLYLIDRRFPVNINLRWLMQCVVLAPNAAGGGVTADFFETVKRGLLSSASTVPCDNYHFAPPPQATATLPLRSWLSKAPFLFTQTGAADPLSPLQIKEDVYASVRKALSHLGVFDVPDLVCVSAEEGWDTAFTDGELSLPGGVASAKLHRFRLPGLDFAMDQESTSVAVTEQIFEDSGNTSIYEHVFAFLLQDTGSASWDFGADATVTPDELLRTGVLKDVLEDVEAPVPLADRYAKYKYVNLETKLPGLSEKLQSVRQAATEDYLDDALRSTCQCSAREAAQHAEELCASRRRLRTPEYSRQGTGKNVRCRDLRVLPCSAERVEALIDLRMGLHPPFLAQDELLYLVLLIFEYEISYTASGGFTPLHQVLDPRQAQFVRDLYEVPLPDGSSVLSLREAAAFNRFLDRHDAMSFKCQPQEFDYYQETNMMHVQLRDCKQNLQKALGWRVPRDSVLALKPRRRTLHSGFYLSYMQRPPEETFLDTLLQTAWHEPEHTSPEKAICRVTGEAVRVMAPFWGEYFDVASNMGGQDSAQDPALACDFERSSAASILMVYDTLCARSSTSLEQQACAEHPGYQRHLAETLPEECAREDGRVVVRRQLGALNDGEAPLCDRRPSLPSNCELKHGSLNGRLGTPVEDLGAAPPVDATETGFWNPASSIFRGVEALGGSAVRALAIDAHDIAGHCLEFSINAAGVLHLRSAYLASECESTRAGGEVQSWLSDVEEEWAWDHAHSLRLHVVEEGAAPAWTCPLHWLQQYHDDNTRFQARSPSWQRNAARFEHITLEHKYAHPTVRHANKVRGVRAARFLSDALGCVAAAEDCHAKAYLDRTLENLLRPEDDWHKVAYVPESHPECTRVLDWPEDCGKARPDAQPGQHGECRLRQ